MSDREQDHKPWTIRGVPPSIRATIKAVAASADRSIGDQLVMIVEQWQWLRRRDQRGMAGGVRPGEPGAWS